VREALEDKKSAVPLALVARQARRTVLLLDPDAAQLIRPR
jgi:hypothetical protein